MGAALFYGIALNHPFHNGNKRTALLSLVWLLD
ncbi:MAG TPA: Fic family protein, partial [Gemmatimonadales bacterium]|nr:Fic family protein [Gemmatimonadales bacterium]